MSSVIEIPQSRWKQWNYQLASRLKWTEAVHPWFGNRCSNSVISESGYCENGISGTYVLGKTSLVSQWLRWMWGKMYLFSGYTRSTLSVLGLHTLYVKKKKKKRRQVCLNFCEFPWHMHTFSWLMDPRMVGICRAFSVAAGSRLQNNYHDCIWEKRLLQWLIWETLQNRCLSPGRWQVLTSGCKVLNTLWPAQLCVRLWLFSHIKVFVHKDTQLLWNSCVVRFFSACYWACSLIAASLTPLSSTILFCYGFSSASLSSALKLVLIMIAMKKDKEM